MMKARLPLALEPQPEGDCTVTSPLLPELSTEGDTMARAIANFVIAAANPLLPGEQRPYARLVSPERRQILE